MLSEIRQTRNWNATSDLVTGDRSQSISFFNASYNGVSTSFTKNSPDEKLYRANKEMVDADYEQFESEVNADIGE